MFIIAQLISFAIQFFILIVVLQVALSWLIALDIVNKENDAAQRLGAALAKVTEPVYAPIRKFVPPIAGIDITPLLVIIGVQILGSILVSIFI